MLKATLGVEGPEEALLFRPRGILFDEDGDVYIPDEGHHSILVFDRDGNYRRRIGREGKGPGEIQSPSEVFFSWEGELVVHDQPNNRISYFTKEGEFLRSRNIGGDTRLFFVIGGEQQIPTVPGEYLRPAPRVLPLPPELGGPPEAEQEKPPLLLIVNRDGAMIRSVGQRKTHSDPHSANLINEISFDFHPQGEIAVTYSFLNEIHLYNPASGSLKRIINRRLAFDPIEPHMEEVERSSPDGRELLLVLTAFVDPVSYDVAYDDEGRIWVLTSLISSEEEEARQESGMYENMMRLEVFSSAGQLLTAIPLEEPANRLVFDAVGDLWLLDSLYNLTVRRFDVVWP